MVSKCIQLQQSQVATSFTSELSLENSFSCELRTFALSTWENIFYISTQFSCFTNNHKSCSLSHDELSMIVSFLPITNEVCEGYVFTGVCLSTGGVCPIACWDTITPPSPEADSPPCAVHAGIRSTSGRYASHWNAFLFSLLIFHTFWIKRYLQLQ